MVKRKQIGMIALGAALCLLIGAPSFAAGITPGDTLRFSFAAGHLSGFNGGAFTVTDTTSGFAWNSFCLEYNEYIDFSSTFSVSSIGPSAINGGVGNSGTPGLMTKVGNIDPISSKTAYLYYRYATGGIAGVSGAGTGVQQKALQNVFWYLENEISSLPTTDTGGYAAAFLAIANSAQAGNYYGVQVLNPVYNNRTHTPAQSQLVYIPVSVPEAGALLFFGTGLVGLVGYRRVRRMQ